ncbi:MAG: hypothetical protein M3Y19_07455 [Actinomycetota bacterium]|nr:hypothetical protein [Actinomycetota bacterium]
MTDKILERCRRDLARGEPWRARDRLYGALRDYPTDERLLDLLGQVLQQMGDLPAAGAAWFLSNRADDDPATATARAALRARFRAPIGIGRSLPLRARFEDYPPRARLRLEQLGADIKASGQDWPYPAPKIIDFSRRTPIAPRRQTMPPLIEACLIPITDVCLATWRRLRRTRHKP